MNKFIYTLLAVCCAYVSAFATDYYWIGGTGNWNDLTQWATTSGGSTNPTSLPDINDNVFFDANSFTSSSQVVTLTSSSIAYCDNLAWTYNGGELTGASSADFKVGGSIVLSAGCVLDLSGDILLEATGSETIQTNGSLIDSKIYVNAGTWTLQDNLVSNQTLYLHGGSFSTNGNDLECNNLWISGGSTSKTLNISNSTLNLKASFYASSSAAPATTFIATNSTINLTGGNSLIRGADNFTFNTVNFTNTAPNRVGIEITTDGAQINTLNFVAGGELNGNNSMTTLNFTPGFTYSFEAGHTQTIGTLNVNGNCNAVTSIVSDNPGVRATISATTTTISYTQVQDMIGTGAASFSVTDGTDLGNNIGWSFSGAGIRNLFWIGGSGNWSDENHWATTSGGSGPNCPPTAVDNVSFDGNSFSSSTQTVTLDGVSYCNDMTWSSVPSGINWDGAASNDMNIYGSLVLASGMDILIDGDVYFQATTSGKTITMNNGVFPSNIDVYFSGTGGVWTYQDKFSAAGTVYLANGTVNTNSQDVWWDGVREFGSNTVTLNLGASDVEVTSNGFAWWVFNSNFILNAGTSTIRFTHPVDPKMRFNQGQAFHDVIFTAPNARAELTNNTGLSFNTLTFMGNALVESSQTMTNLVLSAGKSYQFGDGQTQTITNLIANGSCSEYIALSSTTAGARATFQNNGGSDVTSFIQLQDFARTGSAITINNGVDLGNNSGWTISATAARDLYWIGGAGNWSDENNWALTSGGSGPECPPSAIDNVFFDANSFSSTGQVVDLDIAAAACNNMTWTGVTGSPVFSSVAGEDLTINGSMVLDAGMTLDLNGAVYFASTSGGNVLTSAGNEFEGAVYFDGAGGNWTLTDAFVAQQYLYMNEGTLNTNNNDLTWNHMRNDGSGNATMNLGASDVRITGDGGFAFWITNPNFSLNAGTSHVQFMGGNPANPPAIRSSYSLSFYDVTFTGAGEIEPIALSPSHTFNSTTLMGDASIFGSNNLGALSLTGGQTYTFESGVTQFMTDFITNGTPGSPVEIIASTFGIQSVFSMPSGGDDICARNVFLRDNNAIGGATWNAPASSFNGNVTGWVQVECTNTTLNLDLTNFTATAHQTYNKVNWTIAQPSITGLFEVQRSAEGINWEALELIAVNEGQTAYSLNDYNLQAQTYYRLKHIDAAGNEDLSSIIEIKRKEASSAISLYPNPADATLRIRLNDAFNKGAMQLIITNHLGQVIRVRQTMPNRKILELNTSNLSNGYYNIQLLQENKLLLERVRIQH